MTVEVWAMIWAGVVALVAGFILAAPRLRATSGADKVLLMGPIFEAVALAMFAAEHFTAAHDLMGIVPRWLPWPLFWTYFFGVALLAAAISFIIWRCVRWSASLLALFFLIIVFIVSLPNLPAHTHERLFWTLLVRELSFGSGAIVLAVSLWQPGHPARAVLLRIFRGIVAVVMIFYAIQHFLFPKFAPGVPLELLTPAWVPAPVFLAYVIGIVLLLGGIGLLVQPTIRIAAAGAGIVLVVFTAAFYVPIAAMDIHTKLAVQGLNYIGDTWLYAATILLAGFGAHRPAA
jgi:uncharacterized membrane protein